MPKPAAITHVSDTARWVAIYRALETERPDAIFHDPYARRLAGERGAEITKAMDKRLRGDWPMVVRTAVMDEIILRAVNQEGCSQVVNLAAGLDARPWRLPLAPTLRWVDVDHAVMIDHKLTELADEKTACEYEGVRLDLADVGARRELFRRLSAEQRKTLVVSEGLLIYLDPESVASLATDLAQVPGFDEWLIDLASPGLIRMMHRTWGKKAAMGNAPFKFAPAEGTAFFATHGWVEREYHNTMEEGFRLKRTFAMAKFWRFVGKLMPKRKQEEFKRFSGIVLLRRGALGAAAGGAEGS